MEAIRLNPFYTSIKFKIILLLILLLPFVVYATIQNAIILYIDMIVIISVAFIFAVMRYLHQKNTKKLDIEIAMLLAIINWILLMVINPNKKTIIFPMIYIFVFLFIYRQAQVPIKENIIFLISYGLFFFLLNFKFISLSSNVILTVFLDMTISVLFAYALLATAKTTHFYRCTHYCCTALICLLVVGRITMMKAGQDYEALTLAHALTINILVYTFIYWYEDKEFNMGHARENKIFFDAQMLPHFVGWLAFLSYLLEIDLNNRTAIWGLVTAVLLWYFISIFIWLKSADDSKKDEASQTELTKKQLDRLDKHIQHMKAAELFKIK